RAMTMTLARVQRINSDNFAPYGKVAVLGNEKPLASGSQFKFWSDHASFRIEGETEIGFCTVFPPRQGIVDWMERHARTPEILIPIDWPFVLPVMRDGAVEAFEVYSGEAVMINPDV